MQCDKHSYHLNEIVSMEVVGVIAQEEEVSDREIRPEKYALDKVQAGCITSGVF